MHLFLLIISGGEIIFVFLAVLLLFGSKKIPEFARMLGKGMNEFKKATDDIKKEFSDSTDGFVDDIKQTQQDINREVKELGDSMTESEGFEPYEDLDDEVKEYSADSDHDNEKDSEEDTIDNEPKSSKE